MITGLGPPSRWHTRDRGARPRSPFAEETTGGHFMTQTHGVWSQFLKLLLSFLA